MQRVSWTRRAPPGKITEQVLRLWHLKERGSSSGLEPR